MFCEKCGNQISDEAMFCSACGNKVGSVQKVLTTQSTSSATTKFVPAKCTNCGGILNVDSSQDAAICPFCDQPYIIEKAISNYNVSITGNIKIDSANITVNGAPSIENLLKRAQYFECEGNVQQAMNYYNRVLDIDINNAVAKEAIEKIKNVSYATVSASCGFTSGSLELKRNYIVFKTKSGKEVVTRFDEMVSVGTSMGLLSIMTTKTKFLLKSSKNPNGNVEINYGIVGKQMTQKWVKMINDARNGIFPEEISFNHFDEATQNYTIGAHILSAQDYNNIRQLLLTGNKIKAIAEYRRATEVGLAEAKADIETLEKKIVN